MINCVPSIPCRLDWSLLRQRMVRQTNSMPRKPVGWLIVIGLMSKLSVVDSVPSSVYRRFAPKEACHLKLPNWPTWNKNWLPLGRKNSIRLAPVLWYLVDPWVVQNPSPHLFLLLDHPRVQLFLIPKALRSPSLAWRVTQAIELTSTKRFLPMSSMSFNI
jgi:hypothetical protein